MRGYRRANPPYKVLSVLLSYPDGRLIEAHAEVAAAVAAITRSPVRDSVARFTAHLERCNPLELAQATSKRSIFSGDRAST